MAEKKEKKAKEVKNEEVETVVNPLEEENAKLKEEISSLNAKVEEVQADYLRARADCENVRKRKGEEVRKAYEDGKAETVEKILGIGDSLDWALKMPLDEKTKEGIEMLLKKYHETLANLGVTEFTPEVGTPFDPNTANAVMQMDGEEGEESGNVKQVFGRGYKLGEKVIRYAQVTVVK
ncbi:MAG: nucleotide exchange factor GrpE [Clostridiales bacterium]|nr:nucleotide exchange factor GrpE [Clostridiales bacterium]